MWRSSAADDLQQYRSHYPNKVEKPDANDNVAFYRNELEGPQGLTHAEVLEKHAKDYKWLERSHDFIQWLFPIQERGLNPDAQVLMKHEIEQMRRDPEILERAWASFELMLDFYGMKVTRHPDAPLCSVGLCTVPWQRNKSSECTAVTTEPFVFAKSDSPFQAKLYFNLCHSSHNYLRITRILKFLGEMGMEDAKLSWLIFLGKEVFAEPKLLKPCGQSLMNFWSGTIYDDEDREKYVAWLEAMARRKASPRRRVRDEPADEANEETS